MHPYCDLMIISELFDNVNEYRNLFEALVPQSVKDLEPNNPNRVRYDDLSKYSKDEVEALFVPWNLNTTIARKRLIRLWREHPERLKQSGKC